MSEQLLSARQFGDQCVCLNLQHAARAIARRYDAALRPVDLTSGQFAILAALNRPEPVAITVLATTLGVERTTLTRNLAPLKTRRLVEIGNDAGDQRIRAVSLSAAGRAALSDAMPLWREAQTISLAALGTTPWTSARNILDGLGQS